MGNSNTEILLDIAGEFIKDYQTQKTGALYEWNEKTAIEFARVPLETLITDPYFLGFKDTIYDGVLQDIIDLFEERKKRQINLAIFLEGIGSGKTLKASIIEWLEWFEVSMCQPTPQEYFNLAPNSVIALINLNRTEQQARKVTFTEVWNRFQSPFNKDYFPPSDRFTTEIRIPRNSTTIFPGTSSALSALGYNLYGGVIDEAAFLEVVDESTRVFDGRFDAAEQMYQAILNRMVSRFLKNGVLPGLLCMITSPNFPDDFLHRQIAYAVLCATEAKNNHIEDKSGIFWRRRSTWEAKGIKFYPENEFFYIDTENIEIIEDPTFIAFLSWVETKKFPLNLELESLYRVSKFLKSELY